MIINTIHAQNVLKYADLSIDVSGKELIGITGQNESGKSSIGETICLALFGRTFSIGPDEIGKAIRWGEQDCTVTLECSVADTRYSLSRFLDRDGRHTATLSVVDDPNAAVVRGVQAVSEAVFDLLGFEHEHFVESFYLAQREIIAPHPHSHAVRIMAGVAPFVQVARELATEIAEREASLSRIDADRRAVEAEIEKLDIQDGWASSLEKRRDQTARTRDHVNQLVDKVDTTLETYTNNTSVLARAKRSRRRAAVLRALVLLLALVGGGVWALLTYGGDLPQAEVGGDLLAQVTLEPDAVVWIGSVAVALGIMGLLLWFRVGRLARRITILQKESSQLGEALAEAREVGLDDTELEDGERARDVLRPPDSEYRSLRAMLDTGDVSPDVAQEYAGRETAWLRDVGEQLTEQLAVVSDQIRDEDSRLREARNLTDMLDNLTGRREHVEERIAVRQRGIELLDGAVVHQSGSFNRDVRNLMMRTLSLLTGGKYEHLKVSDDLSVRVFSNEKRDFMDLDEISSGTQRQIMLALRLTLAKKLLSRIVKGKQFAFLDEPFAFFDQERTNQALEALANLGDNISQIWIVAQDFPENCDVTFDAKISCARERDTLTVG